MTDRRATPLLALVALIVSLSLALATIALRALVGSVSLGSQSDYWLFNTVVAVIFPLAGVVILRRQRRHLVGWLFIAGGFGNGVTGVGTMYSALALHTFSGRLQGGAAAWWVASWAWILLPIAFVFTLIVFPNGRPLTARWHPLLATAALGGGAWIAGAATTSWDEQGLPRWIHGDNPLRLAPGPAIEAGGLLLVLVTLVAAAVSILLRFRRSRGEERAQLKWMALAAFPLAATFVSFFFGDIGGALVSAIAVVLFAAPIAVGILRYRLYDVDVVISRTLVYTALAGFITAFYVAIVVGIGTVIGQGGRPNLPLSILATALVAVAFQPLRERLQRVANRLVYGRRATPYEVLSDLAARMAETVARDELLPRMARALAEGTGATHATVWLRHNGEMRPLASWPGQVNELPSIALDGEVGFAGSDVTAPVRHQGQLLGALTLRKRPGEPLTPLEEKLLSDLASQTGLVLRNVALTDELIARLDELRASRQRLVSAQDAERRRLERNLHDGAQQNLVALKVKVSLAERMAQRDPQRVLQLLAELKAEADEALETLRDLARGIYPPLLADKGLVAAVESQARKATVPVTVEARGVGRYAEEVEATVYFCVLEALQNVAKYAEATSVTVRLEHEGQHVRFSVNDNGSGFDPATTPRGSGLQNMSDRLDAMGGELEISSREGAGTSVNGAVPVCTAAVSR